MTTTLAKPAQAEMVPQAAITVDRLTKRYGDKLVVDNLTFSVRRGVVTGFLGPNGSGKTTTIRMIFGLARPTSGTALIDGQPFWRLAAPSRHAGLLIDGAGAHPKRTARDHLRVLATERGIRRDRVDELLEVVDLAGDADRPVGGFSLGMRQRLDLATALLSDPPLLVLDEPANGLDPAGIRWLRTFLRSFAARGGTVLVSSHQLAELGQLADEVVVINHGRLVAHTGVERLTSSGYVTVRTPDGAVLRPALAAAGARIRAIDEEHFEVYDLPADQVGVLAARYHAVLHELSPTTTSLEDVFLDLTSEGVRS